MDKNFIPYDSVVSYVNSTIKELIFPGLSFLENEQILKRGKKVYYKESQNIHDKFSPEIDITFKAVFCVLCSVCWGTEEFYGGGTSTWKGASRVSLARRFLIISWKEEDHE